MKTSKKMAPVARPKQTGFAFDDDLIVETDAKLDVVATAIERAVAVESMLREERAILVDAPVPPMTHDELTGDRNGPRCIELPDDEPAPTIMAGGIGGAQVVNLGGYDVRPTPTPSDGSKPPYRVPLMSEIAQLPKNGLVVVSTFSGCGGSCLGFKMAGYDVAWASEFIPAAQETYRANHPTTHLDTRDIRQVTAESIRSVVGDREIDVFEGSPPCASFSTAGKTSKGWNQVRKYSDTEQRTDDLFGEYIRLLKELKPRAFVAENVAGMTKGVSKGHFKYYMKMFQDLPYRVEAQLLDAADLGVPQRRVRLIFVGVRNDVKIPSGARLFPTKLRYADADGNSKPLVYSVRDAIPWIARMQDQYGAFTEGGKGNSTREKKTLDVDVEGPAPTVRAALSDQFRAEGVAQPFVDVDPKGQHAHQQRTLDEVAPTIRASNASHYGLMEPTAQDGRVVYHEGFKDRKPEDITDQPAPTVKVGVNALCSTHFLVEGAGHGDEDTKVTRRDMEQPTSKRIHHDEAVGDDVGASLDGYAVGEEWDKLKPGEASEKFFSLVKTDPDLPCQTVTAAGATTSAIGAPGGVASVTHPYERRKFTLAELRRICGFPDDFVLTGTYAQGWERLGRAVPPPMMKAVAECLAKILCAAS